MESLGSDNLSSECHFLPYTPERYLGILLLHIEPCMEAKIPSYHFLHYTENDNAEFFHANQSF